MSRLSEAERVAAALDRPRRATRWLIEVLPACLTGLVLLSLFGGPHRPAPEHAVGSTPLLVIMSSPLTVLPQPVAQGLWVLLTALAQRLVLARTGVARGAVLGLGSAAVVVLAEPFRVALMQGRADIMVLALVVGDLLPRAVGERRWLPRGIATGFAVAAWPVGLLFLGYAALVARRWVAPVGLVAALGFTGIGIALDPVRTRESWSALLFPSWGEGPKQSLIGLLARGFGPEPGWLWGSVGLFAGVLAVLAAIAVGRLGEAVLAVGLVGVGTCLAAAAAGLGQHGWSLLIGLGALAAAGHRRRRVAGRAGRGSPVGLPRWLTVPCLAYAGWVGIGLSSFAGPAYPVLYAVTPLLGFLLVLGLLAYLLVVRPVRTRDIGTR